MTNNQLTYWANIERERADRAQEALEKQRIAAQRYAARLSYAASVYSANAHLKASQISANTSLSVAEMNKRFNEAKLAADQAFNYAKLAQDWQVEANKISVKQQELAQEWDTSWFNKYGSHYWYFQNVAQDTYNGAKTIMSDASGAVKNWSTYMLNEFQNRWYPRDISNYTKW